MNEGRKYRTHLGSSSGTKQSSFRPRTNNDNASSRGKNGVDDSNHRHYQSDSQKQRESLSKKKSSNSNSKQYRSISGDVDAIRSFSRNNSRGQMSTWKPSRPEKKSWKESIGSSPEKKPYNRRLGDKLSGKSATVGEESEGGESSGVPLFIMSHFTPTT